MNISEYYDSIASFWDMDYSEALLARSIAAAVSISRFGGLALDIGCGSGGIISDLIKYGAWEIEGIDISEQMTSLAKEKFSFDPRINIEQMDFLSLNRSGYDVAIAFNSYHHFLSLDTFLKKANEVLREDGRLTVAYGFDCNQINKMNSALPKTYYRRILPAKVEAKSWAPYFKVDLVCNTEEMYIISGRAIPQ